MPNRVSPRELESLRSLFSRDLKMCHLVDPKVGRFSYFPILLEDCIP